MIYVVRDGDNCIAIEMRTGVKVEELRLLNKLDSACTIMPGQELILTVIQATQTPTLDPATTATALLPTPTAKLGSGEICVVLFADLNGDAARQDNEGTILGGAVSITDRSGSYSRTGMTSGTEDRLCFADVPEGEYNIALAVPDGYNPTTTTNYPLKLIAGNRSVIDFGAQASSRPPVGGTDAQNAPAARSPLLLIAGGILVLGGLALAAYFRFVKR